MGGGRSLAMDFDCFLRAMAIRMAMGLEEGLYFAQALDDVVQGKALWH